MTTVKAKELVGLIFGETYAKDEKVVAFYKECNEVLLAEEKLKAYNLGYDIGWIDREKGLIK